MRTKLTAALVGVLMAATLVHGETNMPTQVATNKADFERLMKVIAERAKRGEAPIGIQLTPELHEQLAADGTIPSTNDANALVRFRFENTPLKFVAEQYAEYTGKKVVVDKGLSATVSARTDKSVQKAQAVVLIEKAFADAGLVIVPVDTNTVRIIQQTKER